MMDALRNYDVEEQSYHDVLELCWEIDERMVAFQQYKVSS